MRAPEGIVYLGVVSKLMGTDATAITLTDLTVVNAFAEGALQTRVGRGHVSTLGAQAFHITGRPVTKNPNRHSPIPSEMTFRRRIVRTAGRVTPRAWNLMYSLDAQVAHAGWGRPELVNWFWTIDGFAGSLEGFRADALLMRIAR